MTGVLPLLWRVGGTLGHSMPLRDAHTIRRLVSSEGSGGIALHWIFAWLQTNRPFGGSNVAPMLGAFPAACTIYSYNTSSQFASGLACLHASICPLVCLPGSVAIALVTPCMQPSG